MKKEKVFPVLIDCDPGADDFFALLWILINHKFSHIPMKIVAITTVGGNVSSDITYENVLRVCKMLDIDDILVGKDLRKGEAEDASHIHGNDGIGNLSTMLPEISLPKKTLNSVEVISDAIKEYGKGLTILTMGPLTNLALVEKKNPGSLEEIKRIISMGGAIKMEGNVTPTSEFNIYYDAKSAKKVFNSTDNIVLLPLDVTTSLAFTVEDLENSFLENHTGKKQKFIRELTNFVIDTNMKYRETKYQKGFFIHDAHTVGFFLYPHIYSGRFMRVNIETEGEYTLGQTIAERRNTNTMDINCFVIESFNKEKFLDSFTQDFKQFDFR